MNKKSYGFAPILILVILGAIGLVSYFIVKQTSLSPTPASSTPAPQELPPPSPAQSPMPTLVEDTSAPEFLEVEENTEGLINAIDIFDSSKLSEHERDLLSNFYWAPLKAFSSEDTEREVYLVDCETTNDPPWEKLTGIPEKVPNTPNIAEVTLERLVEKHYGSFPDSKEIANYEKVSGRKYKNKDSGINGVLLKEDGDLAINFYDSVAAYGGGSARVSCMGLATSLTAKQFPGIKSVIMCIDKYPSGENDVCFYDFQP